jgi:hypothetical protein
MPSKLKRRIPVIFSGVGAASSSASVAAVGVSNIPPSWTDTLGDSFSVTAGVPFSYTFTAYDPNPGDLIDFIQNSISAGLTITENDQSGLYRTITISSSTGLAAGTYTASLDIDEVPTAEADWLLRSGQDPNNPQTGVVWAHDFREAGEFTAFYNNLGQVSASTSGGFGNGGYLTYTIPKGIPDGKHYIFYDSASGWLVTDGTAQTEPAPGVSTSDWTWITSTTATVCRGAWQRPLAAFAAGTNGKSTADPAANGTVTRRTLTSTSAQNYASFQQGYYGHADYHATQTNWPQFGGGTVANPWDGTDFYIQYRVKISASRFGSTSQSDPNYNTQRYAPGKLAILYTTYNTPSQAIVVQSRVYDPRFDQTTARFSMYAHSDQSSGNFHLTYPPFSPTNAAIQPGGDYDPPASGTCLVSDPYAKQYCWEWPADEWVTVLMHIIPGHYNVGITEAQAMAGNATYKDTGIQVWVARAGQTSYTTLFDVTGTTAAFPFWFGSDGIHPYGWNMFVPSGYMNNAPSIAAFTQQFTQIIFSKSTIPCPQA